MKNLWVVVAHCTKLHIAAKSKKRYESIYHFAKFYIDAENEKQAISRAVDILEVHAGSDFTNFQYSISKV